MRYPICCEPWPPVTGAHPVRFAASPRRRRRTSKCHDRSRIFTSLLFLGLPIALVLAMVALRTISMLSGNPVLYLSFPQQLFASLENYGLLAIPLFLAVGELMNEGGITRRLVALASVFVGHLRGGLAYINILANMFLASIMGSANAQVAVMSQVMVPEMVRRVIRAASRRPPPAPAPCSPR
jgi:TRAP-type mannitol/chloroaromatic compound transport system permease large subunit